MENTLIKSEDYKGFVIELHHDIQPCPESPREWDNLGTMFCTHRRYSLGDEQFNSNNYESFENFEKQELKDCIVLPVYMYDHSGITIATTSFNCRWDSGQIGFIAISKQKVREEFNVKRISPKLHEKIELYLNGEVETYDKFLRGEVYGYNVKLDNEDCDEIASCYGFYSEEDAIQQAQEEADAYLKRNSIQLVLDLKDMS